MNLVPDLSPRNVAVRTRTQQFLVRRMGVSDMRLDRHGSFAFILDLRRTAYPTRAFAKRMIQNGVERLDRHQGKFATQDLARVRQLFLVTQLDGAGAGISRCSGGL